MKLPIAILAGALLALPAAADKHAAPKGSPSFEKLKTLVGTWTGTMEMEGKPTEMKLVYRLVAGGSVLEERSFPGTPMEMVTMYHDSGDKLVLTHYCMLGNQPRLQLKAAEGNTLAFELDPTCAIDAGKDMFMGALKVTFVDADTVRHDWTMYAEGKAMESQPISLERVKE